jgi:hypothetical protein
MWYNYYLMFLNWKSGQQLPPVDLCMNNQLVSGLIHVSEDVQLKTFEMIGIELVRQYVVNGEYNVYFRLTEPAQDNPID